MKFTNFFNDLSFEEIYSVFYHPSKFETNDNFFKYEFIGDGHIERTIKDFIFMDYPYECVNFYNKLLNLFVSNDSLAIVALEHGLHEKLKYSGNLTINILADTVEALIGSIATQIYNYTEDHSQKKSLDDLICNTIYLIDDDSDGIYYLYHIYLCKATQIADTLELGLLQFQYGNHHNPKELFFESILKVNSRHYKGISRSLCKSRLICLLKFIQSQSFSLDFFKEI